MTKLNITDILDKPNISNRLFSHLSNEELKDCALVNKRWRLSVKTARIRRCLTLTGTTLERIEKSGRSVNDFIAEEYKYLAELVISGSYKGKSIPNSILDSLFDSRLPAKRLVLHGRGNWDTCCCPKQHKSMNGEQFGPVLSASRTKLEQIHVTSTFKISACALLDLVSRSPNLEVLHFYGEICLEDHDLMFHSKLSYSNLDRVYWPWAKKKDLPTLRTIIKRNENITTFYSTAKVTCDLLSKETLPNLRFLSLSLNENWACKPGKTKNAAYFSTMMRYLGLAKNVEALEVRTFDPDKSASGCPDTITKIEKLYETYRLEFWEQVARLQNLKYLAVFGSWEFEMVCREMARNNLQIEYLKINLLPSALIAAVEAADDTPVLTMADGFRNLKKLPQLKSLHYICPEKLGSMDAKASSAMKELIDLIWILDIKTNFTEETEDLLNNVMRRGNQLGKVYKLYLHIQSKPESNLSDLLLVQTLKFPLGTNLKAKLNSIAEAECNERYGKLANYQNFHIWGLEQVGNCRDRSKFDMLKYNWRYYNEKFFFNLRYL